MNYQVGNPIPDIYPRTQTGAGCFRFTDKSNTVCERLLISNWWQEQLNMFGQRVDYYVNNTTTLSADMLYGEQPTQRFSSPLSFTIGINLNENALLLSKYGVASDDEVTAFFHISAFYDTFGAGAEPKSGDVFSLSEYGSDRPGSRRGNFYEITQRLDQDIAQINPLAGHYVWLIKAKRFESSFEPGLSGESGNEQVFEDTRTNGVSGADKTYSYSANTAASTVFNYNSSASYDDVYGGYA